VFKVEYFLYIIQVMLQYTPSFNKVCYTLRLQGCLIVYKNITKNNNLLNLAIQNKNIKANISHPLQRKNITLFFRGYVVHLCARQFFYFFKKERKNRVIFFLCRGCDILALIFLF
jgi:hypothetical protein